MSHNIGLFNMLMKLFIHLAYFPLKMLAEAVAAVQKDMAGSKNSPEPEL